MKIEKGKMASQLTKLLRNINQSLAQPTNLILKQCALMFSKYMKIEQGKKD